MRIAVIWGQIVLCQKICAENRLANISHNKLVFIGS